MGKQKREKKIIPIEILKKKKMRGDGREEKKEKKSGTKLNMNEHITAHIEKTWRNEEMKKKQEHDAPPEPHLYGMH